jgi:hypothetical protein
MSYSPWEAVRGVELPWIVLGAGGLILAAGVVRLARIARIAHIAHRPRLVALHSDEQGVTYSLNYVLVIPIYLLLVCMVVEATFLVTAKIGTMYSAHAGARSAVVWDSANPQDLRDKRVRQSVLTAMAPFASVNQKQLAEGAAPQADDGPAGQDFARAYADHSRWQGGNDIGRAALENKYRGAAGRTTYTLDVDRSRPDGDVKVTVTYRAPMFIPGAARLFDRDGQAPYEYTIQTTAILPNEAPVSADRTLGIDYRSR